MFTIDEWHCDEHHVYKWEDKGNGAALVNINDTETKPCRHCDVHNSFCAKYKKFLNAHVDYSPGRLVQCFRDQEKEV